MILKKFPTVLLFAFSASTYATSYVDNTTDAAINIICGESSFAGTIPSHTKTPLPEGCTKLHMQYVGSADHSVATCPIPVADKDINNVAYRALYNPYYEGYGDINNPGMLVCDFPPPVPVKPRSLTVENQTEAALDVELHNFHKPHEDDIDLSHECAHTTISSGQKITYENVDLCGPGATLFIHYVGSRNQPMYWQACEYPNSSGVSYATIWDPQYGIPKCVRAS